MGEHSNDRLTDLLRDKGLKATKPRLVTLELMLNTDGHHSVEDIYQTVRRGRPHISMATVYRVLEDLASLKMIGYLRLGADKIYYERRTDPHRHAICRGCGEIRDIEPVRECLEECAPGHSTDGFRYDTTEVIFVGLCSRCQAAPATPHPDEAATA